MLASACVALALWSTSVQAASDAADNSRCLFHKYIRDDRIDYWELQTKLPHSKLKRPFEHVAKQAFEALEHIAKIHDDINITIHHDTQVSKVFTQAGWSLTTYDGKQLYPSKGEAPLTYPWTDGYLRKRSSIFLDDPERVYQPEKNSCPYDMHNADLTVKFRHIDLDAFDHTALSAKFPDTVPDAKTGVNATLVKAIESDQYCNTGNVQFKATYLPVNMALPTHNLEVLQDYYPGLPEALSIPPCAPLPFRRSKAQREAAWIIRVNDVKVKYTLTMEYKTEAKAFTAVKRAVAGEISIKIARKKVEEAHGEFTYSAVDSVAKVVDELHHLGWDSLRPNMPAELTDEDVEPEELLMWDEEASQALAAMQLANMA